MGHEIVYCSLCGARILEKDLASGRAFTLLDKVFCAGCRDQAFSEAGAEEAPEPAKVSAPARPVSGTRQPVVARRPSAPAAGAATSRTPTGHHPVLRRRNYTPLYIGSGVGLIGLIAFIAILMSSGTKPGPNPDGTPEGNGGGPKTPVGPKTPKPADLAAKKLAELHKFAAGTNDAAAIVAEALKAGALFKGTPSEELYRAFVQKWERAKADQAGDKEIDDLLAKAKAIIAADPDFKRYGEVIEYFQRAKELALASGSVKMADVENLRRSVEEPYEARAAEWLVEPMKYARQLVDEGDFKSAIKVLKKFPDHFRYSKAWKEAARVIEDCEKKIAAVASGGDAKQDWKFHLRLGNEELGRKNYARAKEHLLKSEAAMPAPDKWQINEKRSVAWNLYYNLGCLFAIESKKLEGEAKTKAVDEAFRYLGKAAEAEVFSFPCGERDHPAARDHWDKDEDLDSIRSDPRYSELIKKYVK
jgi:hypothetical protein